MIRSLSASLCAALALSLGCAHVAAPARPSPVASVIAAPSPLPAGCDSPDYHRLDFWLGAWDVTNAEGKYDGTNVIQRGLNGCTIEEQWVDAGGWRGESVFYFDRDARIWKQVWVTDTGLLKEKHEETGDAALGVRFVGGHDRTTLQSLPDGRVRQVIEPAGKPNAAWTGTYARLPQACATPDHRRFDFWLGDWTVTVKTRTAPNSEQWTDSRGTNHVTLIMNGCVLQEQFTAAGTPTSWSGKSFSVWSPTEKRWRQTWVDNSGSYLAFTGDFVGGEMTLTGEPRPNGSTMRMVFTDISKDHFLWRWEGSADGKAWRPMMTIDYVRASVSHDRG